MIELLVGNDQLVQVVGLRDAISGDPITNATVTARITKRDGTDVGGENWPISLSYVVESSSTENDAHYRGLFEDDIELVAGKGYWVEVKAVAPGDDVAVWREWVVAKNREFGCA